MFRHDKSTPIFHSFELNEFIYLRNRSRQFRADCQCFQGGYLLILTVTNPIYNTSSDYLFSFHE